MNKIYTVRPGDSLAAIARLAGIGLAELIALNPQIENPNLIYAGQQIVVPVQTDRSDVIGRLARETYPDGTPPWFAVAAREEDTVERKPGTNPRIVEYLATCKGLSAADRASDETPWCSAFANWCLLIAGIAGTRSAAALSWAGWGREDGAPGPGSIVVWRRLEGRQGQLRQVGGHVAFLVEDRGEGLYVLGGNQSDSVCRKTYPRNGLIDRGGSDGIQQKYELVSIRTPI